MSINLRLFWTWDHCTRWTATKPGGHDWGASNEYSGTEEDFLREYSLLLRWCGEHGVDGVVIWGLLRDGHGGVEAACKLADVAHKSGVKILAGVGLNAYGGVYYEGDSPWSLNNHLQANPQLYGLHEDGSPLIYVAASGSNSPQPFHHTCPSRPENQEYHAESLRWLMETVPIDGVQIESGDTGTCKCPLCRERRQYAADMISWEDMALMYPIARDAIRSVRSDAMIVLETYSHPEPVEGNEAPGFGGGSPSWAGECVAKFPRDAYIQWVADGYMDPWNNQGKWTSAARVPEGFLGNIMRSHHGTWWGRYGDEPVMGWLAQMAQSSMACGCNGLSIFGEHSPYATGCELNYLAFADYGSPENPQAGLDSFLNRIAAPLLGSAELAQEFVYVAGALNEPERLEEACIIARANAARQTGRIAQRWAWLAWYLGRWQYDSDLEVL